MKTVRNKTWFTLFGAIFSLLLLFTFACQKQENSIKPVHKKLTEAVYASGNIMPNNDHQLFSEASGYIINQLVKEGDEVKKNQVLFVIKSQQQSSKTEAAKAAYNVALTNSSSKSPVVDELKLALMNAQTKLTNDSINYFRQQKLFEKQATSKVLFEQAQLSYKVAQNEVKRINTQLAQTKDRLHVEMKNAESQYKIQVDEQQNYQIVSDIDGIIYKIHKEKGELIMRNEPIVLIGSKGETYIQLNVDELDINRVKLDQQIVLKIDVYPDEVFKAKVNKIYPMMDQRDQSFRVDAIFTDDFKPPFAGLNVEANIIIQEKENAMVIPKIALVGQDSVWILEDGEKKKVSIEKGTITMEYVEVLSGLTINSQILLNP